MKIFDWDKANNIISQQITDFLKNTEITIVKCKSFSDYQKVFEVIDSLCL